MSSFEQTDRPLDRSHEWFKARQAEVRAIPAVGWGIHRWRLRQVQDMIAILGIRLENIGSLKAEDENDRRQSGSDALATYWRDSRALIVNQGFWKEPLHYRLKLMAHEAGHAVEPTENAVRDLLGGTLLNRYAWQHAQDVARQSIVTDHFISDYHRQLAERLDASDDPINFNEFTWETWAIEVEHMLIGDAQALYDVGLEQYRRLQTALGTPNVTRFVQLDISPYLTHGAIEGVENVDQLTAHIASVQQAESGYLQRYMSLHERAAGVLGAGAVTAGA